MDLPDFFSLDIGNHSIKVVEIKRESIDKAKLRHLGSIPTPFGVLNSDKHSSKKELAIRIKEVLEEAGIKTKKCIAALPESSIFTRLITLPKVVDEEKLDDLIYWSVKQYIPLPLSNVQYDYIPITEKKINGKVMLQLLIVAAPKLLVKRYMDIVSNADLELLALETETIATSRSVTFNYGDKGVYMTLDFGANGTDMSVIKNGNMIFSQSITTGSDAMTKAIASDFNLEFSQAEKYKIAYGLDSTKIDGKIYKSIEPIVQIIVDEVNRTLNFFRTQLRDSVPSKIFLSGDGAKLIMLDKYIQDKTGIATELINPISKIDVDKSIADEVKNSSMVGFSVALGLGLKIK